MKIGAGKIIGAVMFAAGVSAIWLWPDPKVEVDEETVVRPVVLTDEINAQLAAGAQPFDAVVMSGVTRLRPVMNTALTTVLGMIPLVVDPFYSAMAVTVMCGLAFATLLTMVVVPVNYALLFRIPKPDRPHA